MKNKIVIFIRSMRFFGDQLVTYPTLHQLHKLYPDNEIIVIAHDPVEHHYKNLPWDIRFVQADGIRSKYNAIPYDTNIVITLHHSSEQYALISAASLVPNRLGFNNKRVFDFLWTHKIKKDINDYIGLANLRLLNTLHTFDPVTTARECMTLIAAQKTSPVDHSDVIFMVGGGAGAFKRWGIPNYTALADSLIQKMGVDTTFSFIVGPAEEAEIAEICSLNRPEFRLFANRPITEIADLCLNAKLVVANDCGPSHIAQNCCIPYVGLFNEDNPEWFWKKTNTQAVIPQNNSTNIQLITVDQVKQACFTVLEANT